MIATSIAISAAYSLIATLAYVMGYRIIRNSERALTLYALVAMVLRMLSAVLALVVFLFFVKDNEWRITFVVTFSTFYLLMLIFDVVFFIRSQKNSKTIQS